ncbi:DUF2079 domain-containing protein [Iamia sp. SCSIO 61187]|uniref:DUF2079 domain-containing protein n=1 Tax=Iamia sp. SCSIO 61187 TaxID=2722752 RepID=UPI002106B743|nr:DUF2079 domain-containing protein [Iamia sp. SCSIO 61187]QYG93313.1 DUF2079 domain-containing protein [Iamia sp. SCSIO 61187]
MTAAPPLCDAEPDTAVVARPERWRHDQVGMAIGAAMAIAFFVPGYLRYVNRWAVLDLALFDQAAWLLSQGRAPELTVLRENLFGDHVSVVVVAFAPLYRIAATPVWLIAAQAMALGCSVPALRALARQIGGSQGWATLATVGSAPLWAAATFDFHPVVMTVPITAAALAAARRDDTRAATVAGILLALVRADACVMLLGVAVLARGRTRRRLVAVAGLSMTVGVAVPALLHSEQTFARYWGHLGESPLDALAHPWRAIPAVVAPSVLETAIIWLLPVGFLVLARPRWAAAVAIAGLPLLLSSAAATSVTWFHHAAALVPFTVGGAVAALAGPRRRLEHPALLVTGVVAALLVGSPFAPGHPPELRLTDISRPRAVPGLDAALAQVEPDDGVAVEVRLLPAVSRRTTAIDISAALDAGDPTSALADVDVIIVGPERVDEVTDLGWEPAGPTAHPHDLVALRRDDG